jgi:hypothetical protein
MSNELKSLHSVLYSFIYYRNCECYTASFILNDFFLAKSGSIYDTFY